MQSPLPKTVVVLGTGGTISGSAASPDDDLGYVAGTVGVDALVAAAPAPPGVRVETEQVAQLDSKDMDFETWQRLAGRVAQHAARAEVAGIVVTHGTDTMEETAYLTDVMYGGAPPIVFTGAIRPASAPGADGPANLGDAVALASSIKGDGMGAVVVFAGRIHAARYVRKVDSTAAEPFGSPHGGAIGVIHEGRVNVGTFPVRRPPVVPTHLDLRVPIVPTWLGDDGALIRCAANDGAQGLVVQTLGAGHLGPRALAALREAVETIPVAATTRPERGAILYETYGFEGKEADIRELAVAAGGLSAQAARMKLLACLGAGLDRAGIAAAFHHDDT